MKNIFLLAFLAVGCQTTSSTITEPERSFYYASCLQAGFHVTTCECLEDAAVKATGLKAPVTDFGSDSEQAETFMKALDSNIDQCKAKTEALIKETNDGKAQKS